MQEQKMSTAAGKLPPEAPLPVEGFGLHVQSLKNLVSAGLDMKNSADHEALVLPLLQRCGGSIEAIASRIKANLNGGLLDSEDFKSRQAAFGENRLPQKPMVNFGLFKALRHFFCFFYTISASSPLPVFVSASFAF